MDTWLFITASHSAPRCMRSKLGWRLHQVVSRAETLPPLVLDRVIPASKTCRDYRDLTKPGWATLQEIPILPEQYRSVTLTNNHYPSLLPIRRDDLVPRKYQKALKQWYHRGTPTHSVWITPRGTVFSLEKTSKQLGHKVNFAVRMPPKDDQVLLAIMPGAEPSNLKRLSL